MSNLIYVDLLYTEEPADRPRDAARWQPWRTIVRSGDNMRALFRSSEAYTNRQDCIDAAQLAFGDDANVYLRETEHGNVELRLAASERNAKHAELRDADTCGMGDE